MVDPETWKVAVLDWALACTQAHQRECQHSRLQCARWMAIGCSSALHTCNLGLALTSTQRRRRFQLTNGGTMALAPTEAS